MARDVILKLYQDGMMVASATSPSRLAAEADIQHYALVYSQDGPVEVREGNRRRVDLEPCAQHREANHD